MGDQDGHQNRSLLNLANWSEHLGEKENQTQRCFTFGELIHSRETYWHNPSNTDRKSGRNSEEMVEEKKLFLPLSGFIT